jgi:hypothetical protein
MSYKEALAIQEENLQPEIRPELKVVRLESDVSQTRERIGGLTLGLDDPTLKCVDLGLAQEPNPGEASYETSHSSVPRECWEAIAKSRGEIDSRFTHYTGF